MAQILRLPGIRGEFAIGLQWTLETAVPGAKHRAATVPTASVLREQSRARNMRWGAVRKTQTVVQTGFCARLDGVKSPAGIRSLAATIAESWPQPWMGMYRLGTDEDRYWLIAVRDGHAIIPEGDVVGTLAQVERVRARHRELPGWTEQEGGVLEIAQLARSGVQQPALRDLQASRRKPVVYTSMAVVLVAVAVSGYVVWHLQRERVEQAAQAVRARALAAALNAKHKTADEVQPWTTVPMLSPVIDACATAWHPQRLSKKGWILALWSCRATPEGISVETTWNADGGLASDAPGTLSADAKSSVMSDSVPITFPEPEALVSDESEARRAAWTFAQTHAMALELNQTALPTGLPGASAQQPSVRPSWNSIPATFMMSVPPWMQDGSAMPDNVPGLRIANISYNLQHDLWSMSGTLYTTLTASTPAPKQAVSIAGATGKGSPS